MAFNDHNNHTNYPHRERGRGMPDRKNDNYVDIYSHSSYERKMQPKKRPTKSGSAPGNASEKPMSPLAQFRVTMTMLFVSAAVFSVMYLVSYGFHQKPGDFVNTPTANAVSDIPVSEPVSQEPPAEPKMKEMSDTEASEERTEQSSEVSEESKASEEESSKENSEESSEENSEESSEESQDESSTEKNDNEESSRESRSSQTSNTYSGSLTMDPSEVYQGSLVLINKNFSCRSNGENVAPIIDTRPMELYGLTDAGVSVDAGIIDNINSMFGDFYDVYGDTLVMIACGYRSFSTQLGLYNTELIMEGKDVADYSVAPPGYSEHQSGLAFDLNLSLDESDGGIVYDGNDIYSWINENCSRYGFIVRYPAGKEDITGFENEPWHFRYVGEPAAIYIESNGITLEEYIELLHSHGEDDPLNIYAGGRNYSVYYTPAEFFGATQVPVPTDHSYTVSGDNYSGFIVTVDLDSYIPAEDTDTDYTEQDTDYYYDETD